MNIKHRKFAILIGLAISNSAFATLPQSMSPICPTLEQIANKPSAAISEDDSTAYHSCSWSATNDDGKKFASRTDIDCQAKLQSWLPAKSEFTQNHQVKCVYQLVDPYNIIYTLSLYNEKGYQLNEDNILTPSDDND